MIRYIVTCDGNLLMDTAHPGDSCTLESAVLHRKISDGMFDADFQFSILPTHPCYNLIHQKKSVIRITDNGREIFRGDVLPSKRNRSGIKTLTAQSEMKWLADVPDVFSKLVTAETIWKTGSADGLTHWMFRPAANVPSRYFGEAFTSDVDGETRTVYSTNTNTSGETFWHDLKFKTSEVGKKFNLDWVNPTEGAAEHCELTLKSWSYHTETGNIFVRVLYLGNLLIPFPQAADDGITPETIQPDPDDPSTERELDWCICHFIPDYTFAYAVDHEESIIFTRELIEHLPPYIDIGASLTSKTTVRSMFNSVFCRADAATMTGYNAYVPEERRIYRGVCEIEADVDNASVQSCYANAQKWIGTVGGYAKITVDAQGRHYLNLLKESGVRDDTYRVKAGENVIDCNESIDIAELATGIYPVGIAEGNRYTLDDSVTAKKGYPADIARRTVWCEEAVEKYGRIVKYQEYDVSKIGSGTDVGEPIRRQYVYDLGVEDLKKISLPEPGYTVPAVDPRLLGEGGDGPELGNLYLVDIPLLAAPQYMPLTEITTDLLRPSSGKNNYGTPKKTINNTLIGR